MKTENSSKDISASWLRSIAQRFRQPSQGSTWHCTSPTTQASKTTKRQALYLCIFYYAQQNKNKLCLPLQSQILSELYISRHIMEDLSLVLASKELFHSLSAHKIKTLKQAEEHNKHHQNGKVQALLEDYAGIKGRVSTVLQSNHQAWIGLTDSVFEKDPLGYYLTRPTILQIIGAKGSGKTALLLRLALKYFATNHLQKVRIFNCAGGITLPRISRFTKINHEYSDIFGVDDLIEALQQVKGEKTAGLLVIDSQVNLLLGSQKQKIGLGELITSLRDLGWSIYYTNYVQSRLQVDQKQATNHMGYSSQYFGGIPQCKLLIQPQQRSQNRFKITMLKSLDSRYYEYSSQMNESGLGELTLTRRS